MKKFFCFIGVHWLQNHAHAFVDIVSGKDVYRAKCECGKYWLVDSLVPLLGFRVERNHNSEPVQQPTTNKGQNG
jgi:hypothetical protein